MHGPACISWDQPNTFLARGAAFQGKQIPKGKIGWLPSDAIPVCLFIETSKTALIIFQ
jgi:hypothetical protein